MFILQSLRDSFVRLFELGQNLFDTSLLYSEKKDLLADLGARAYNFQNIPMAENSKDIISEIRILDTKIKDLESELTEIFFRSEDTDPLDWI